MKRFRQQTGGRVRRVLIRVVVHSRILHQLGDSSLSKIDVGIAVPFA
jgi:hypothetical protein